MNRRKNSVSVFSYDFIRLILAQGKHRVKELFDKEKDVEDARPQASRHVQKLQAEVDCNIMSDETTLIFDNIETKVKGTRS